MLFLLGSMGSTTIIIIIIQYNLLLTPSHPPLSLLSHQVHQDVVKCEGNYHGLEHGGMGGLEGMA